MTNYPDYGIIQSSKGRKTQTNQKGKIKMYLYAVCEGVWNSYNRDELIISVHNTLDGAIRKWQAVKQQTANRTVDRITNPHYFTVKKIKVED